MLQRLYVHNFRCLENFELTLKGIPFAATHIRRDSFNLKYLR